MKFIMNTYHKCARIMYEELTMRNFKIVCGKFEVVEIGTSENYTRL